MWESTWFLTGWRWKLRVYTTCDRNLKPELWIRCHHFSKANMYNTAKKNSVSLCFFLRIHRICAVFTWKVGAVMKGTKPHSNNLRFTRNASHTSAICLKWPQMGKLPASREAKYDLFSVDVQIFNIHKPTAPERDRVLSVKLAASRSSSETHLKAQTVFLLPEAEVCHLLIPEFIWLHHADQRHFRWDHILKQHQRHH